MLSSCTCRCRRSPRHDLISLSVAWFLHLSTRDDTIFVVAIAVTVVVIIIVLFT